MAPFTDSAQQPRVSKATFNLGNIHTSAFRKHISTDPDVLEHYKKGDHVATCAHALNEVGIRNQREEGFLRITSIHVPGVAPVNLKQIADWICQNHPDAAAELKNSDFSGLAQIAGMSHSVDTAHDRALRQSVPSKRRTPFAQAAPHFGPGDQHILDEMMSDPETREQLAEALLSL